jgi:hypothetical protein
LYAIHAIRKYALNVEKIMIIIMRLLNIMIEILFAKATIRNLKNIAKVAMKIYALNAKINILIIKFLI